MALETPSLTQQARAVVRALATEPNRKPVSMMAHELLAVARRDHGIPRFYFTNLVYRRNAGPAAGYLGPCDRRRIRDRLGKPRSPDLDDKLRFYTRAREVGLPIPRLLATIQGDRVEINGETRPAGDVGAIAAALDDARGLAARGSIFIKPSKGSGGERCCRINADADPGAVEEVARRLHGGIFLVQESLFQHPDVARVNPTALGSLRVHTYQGDSAPHVISMVMRFPLGSAVVDNASEGGMFAAVDERTGRILPPAQTHFQFGAREYDRHPVNREPLDIDLPHWPQVLELVDRGCRAFGKPLIGWDIGFTPQGPVLIEGNSTPDLLLAQIAANGLLNHPKFGPIAASVLYGSRQRLDGGEERRT